MFIIIHLHTACQQKKTRHCLWTWKSIILQKKFGAKLFRKELSQCCWKFSCALVSCHGLPITISEEFKHCSISGYSKGNLLLKIVSNLVAPTALGQDSDSLWSDCSNLTFNSTTYFTAAIRYKKDMKVKISTNSFIHWHPAKTVHLQNTSLPKLKNGKSHLKMSPRHKFTWYFVLTQRQKFYRSPSMTGSTTTPAQLPVMESRKRLL